jgi:hypothetical protein
MMEYWNIGKPIAFPTLPSLPLFHFFAFLNPAVSACSAVYFFFLPGGHRDSYFLCNKSGKGKKRGIGHPAGF